MSDQRIIFTNAPDSYDYGYMENTGRNVCPEGAPLPFREVIVHDSYRYDNFQLPRYHSGLYVGHEADVFYSEVMG